MTGPIFPPGLRRGPDCQIKLRNGRFSLVAQRARNPYAGPLAATAAAVVLAMATGAPILPRALAAILCAICVVLFVAEALR
jgi:hypothetical protein